MKTKYLIFASIFLCGCSQNATQNVMQEDFQAKAPQLITINHYSLPLDNSSNREENTGETILSDDTEGYTQTDHDGPLDRPVGTVMHIYTDEKTGIDGLSVKVDNIHADITSLWNTSFIPMYNQYNENNISNKEVAEELEVLHEEYQYLEAQVQSIKAPESLSTERTGMIEELKSDLSLAISNRSLALIEFKLMNASEDVTMHSELLDIHTKNSLKYMSSAKEHMETLEDIEKDGHSSTDKDFVTTSK